MYKYDNDEPLSVLGWIGTLVVLMIPIVRLVMIFVWGFGDGNQSRKNFAIAYLIILLISVAIAIIIIIINGSMIMTAINQMQTSVVY